MDPFTSQIFSYLTEPCIWYGTTLSFSKCYWLFQTALTNRSIFSSYRVKEFLTTISSSFIALYFCYCFFFSSLLSFNLLSFFCLTAPMRSISTYTNNNNCDVTITLVLWPIHLAFLCCGHHQNLQVYGNNQGNVKSVQCFQTLKKNFFVICLVLVSCRHSYNIAIKELNQAVMRSTIEMPLTSLSSASASQILAAIEIVSSVVFKWDRFILFSCTCQYLVNKFVYAYVNSWRIRTRWLLTR